MTLSGEAISLFVAIIGSAFGVTAYVSRKFAELTTNMKHAFERIDALEDVPPVRRRRRKKASQ